MKNIFFVFMILIIIILFYRHSFNYEKFENITIYPGPPFYGTQMVATCNNNYQPCILYRY